MSGRHLRSMPHSILWLFSINMFHLNMYVLHCLDLEKNTFRFLTFKLIVQCSKFALCGSCKHSFLSSVLSKIKCYESHVISLMYSILVGCCCGFSFLFCLNNELCLNCAVALKMKSLLNACCYEKFQQFTRWLLWLIFTFVTDDVGRCVCVC